MAALLLGVAGAAIGSQFGMGALGWAAGSTLGNVLFPTQNDLPPVFGPRLGDLKVQTSTYGSAIPRAFGTVRLAGNVIWAPPIVETATTTSVSSGGKGGGGGSTQTQTTYSYSADFAVALCEGPIVGVSRIWANGKLIHNLSATASIGSVLASDRSFTVYTGSETQIADPLMEAAEGAGNVPGYRGTAYVVFSALQLGEFGNRIPNMEFEVVIYGTSIAARTIWTARDSAADNQWASIAFGQGVYVATSQSGVGNRVMTSVDGITWVSRSSAADAQWVSVCYGNGLFVAVSPVNYGNQVMTSPDGVNWTLRSTPSIVPPNSSAWRSVAYGNGIFVAMGTDQTYRVMTSPDGIDWTIQTDPNSATSYWTSISYGNGVFAAVSQGGAGKAFVITSSDGIKWTQRTYPFDNQWQSIAFGNGLFVAVAVTGTATRIMTSPDGLNWTSRTNPVDLSWSSVAYGNGLFVAVASPGASNSVMISTDGISWSTLSAASTNNWSAVTFGKRMFAAVSTNGAGNRVMTLPDDFDILTPGTADLGAIVSTLCLESDLTASDIDVTDLTGVTVDGYVVGSRGPIRGMIEPLMSAFFFDATESDNKIKFVRRGGASAVTIPLADLSAQEGDVGNTPDPFDLTRQQEMELPLELNVVYLNSANNYQPSQQSARRLAANSQTKTTIQLPIVMSDNKARQVADAMMYSAWQERMAGSFATSREYAIYEPTDVVTVVSGSVSQTVRLLQKDEGANGIIRWKGVIEDSTVYTQTSTGVAMTTPGNDVPLIGPTLFVPLDIALLREVDDDFGFYYGLAGQSDGWIGAQLYQSTDGGTAYNAVTNGLVLEGPTMGYAAAALGTTGITASTNEKVDEINTVSVVLTSGTLETITRNAMLAGGNVFLLGDEIVQAMVCTLTATLTYTLSRLLRGRLGTEWAMGTHLAGDRFIVLDDNVRTLSQTPNDWNQSYYYKPVSVGKTLAGTNALSFTDTAIRKKPLAPLHLSGGRSTALDLIVEWVRRTRDPAITWNTPTDPPLFETAERYAVDILNGAGLTVRTIEVTEQTATYTVAQQTTDFGSAQASISVTVCQISPEFGRGYTIAGEL